ncbi:MAG: VWA domain-containing protein [Xanthomonadaceae bacterium]|nr:VWA domain-containing protein [Xanthomonadaceae bacterium]
MKFYNNGAFIYFVLLALVTILGFLKLKANQKLAEKWIGSGLWEKVLVGFQPGKRKSRFSLLLISVAFALLALARPQWGQHEETVRVTGLDIFFVLDVSNSMNVEDVAPSRLKKAQHVMRSIIERLKGDRVGVVLFAGSANLVSPLTTDHGYVLELIPTFTPEMVNTQGTDIGSALELAGSAIERGAVDPTRSEQASKVVILISDGEDLEESALIGGDVIKKLGVRFIALGVGTEKGGPIPLRDEKGNLSGYKKDGSTPVTSHFKPDALKKLVSHVEGQYYDVTPSESEVDEIISEIGAMSRGEFQERKTITYIDRFQIPLAIAILFLVIELFIPLRAGRIVVLIFGLLTSSAQAQTLDAYQKNNKGIQSYQSGDIDNAVKYFEEASKASPNNPKIDFNKGVVASQKGESDQAQQLFESALSKAQENGDLEMEAEARYNLGSLLEHKKDYNGAAKQWSELVEKLKDVKQNPELVEKTKARIANLFSKKNQQEQKDKEDKENKDKDKKDKKDDKGKDDDKKDGDDKKDKDQKNDGDDGQDKENKKQSYKKGNQFKSAKLSKEDAERVMAELLGKEKDLQKKIGKKRGKVSGNGKDW